MASDKAPGKTSRKKERQDRQAAALRDNLKKRKEQARQRSRTLVAVKEPR
ncbi:MAG: hypothetical protein H7841_15640 [Magnetospirillum sp. WYHS-4]